MFRYLLFYTNDDGLSCCASLPYSLFSNGYYKGRFSYATYIPEGELKPIESANEFLATVNYLDGQMGLDGENPVSVKNLEHQGRVRKQTYGLESCSGR